MEKESKFSKEIKTKACSNYEKVDGSFREIAKKIGSSKSVVQRWYLRYREHGNSAFD